MSGYREYSRRLAGLKTMRRVTSTMKMVAGSHLHRAQTDLQRARRYGDALQDLVRRVPRPEGGAGRLMTADGPVRNGLLVILTSNRGLCGSFNAGITRAVRDWLDGNRRRYAILRVMFIGRKGFQMFHRDVEMRGELEELPGRPTSADAARIGRAISRAFLERRYDEVHIAGNRFLSPLVHEPQIERLLPVVLPPAGAPSPELVCEPADERLMKQVLLQWVDYRIHDALLHSAASEHGARMAAMENATRNLQRLEEDYTLLRNRARQSAITKELNEIVGGAEALA